MMLCVIRRGIILVVVGARLKQPKGLPHLCVRSISRSSLSMTTMTTLALCFSVMLGKTWWDESLELVESYFEVITY
uniref:Uncharacterized protein n=1 Tax=Brassica campestris TaxID=3711 RepID=A0A3P6DA30_BRACM|nr:unnamed protein product [Brassica rapa]